MVLRIDNGAEISIIKMVVLTYRLMCCFQEAEDVYP